MTLTAHGILGIIEELTSRAEALRDAAESKPVKIEGLPEDTVLASASGLAKTAQFLESTVKELRQLVPDRPVRLPSTAARIRTLVRIVDYSKKHKTFSAVIPGWNPHETVHGIEASDLQLRVLLEQRQRDKLLSEGHPVRAYAWVNIGAELDTELEFSDWDLP